MLKVIHLFHFFFFYNRITRGTY